MTVIIITINSLPALPRGVMIRLLLKSNNRISMKASSHPPPATINKFALQHRNRRSINNTHVARYNNGNNNHNN